MLLMFEISLLRESVLPGPRAKRGPAFSLPHAAAVSTGRTLAASPDGCTAAILLAHGFKSDRLVELINAGLASVTTERVIAGDRAMEVTRVRITDAGRQALMTRRH
jgi:hypothetical protein